MPRLEDGGSPGYNPYMPPYLNTDDQPIPGMPPGTVSANQLIHNDNWWTDQPVARPNSVGDQRGSGDPRGTGGPTATPPPPANTNGLPPGVTIDPVTGNPVLPNGTQAGLPPGYHWDPNNPGHYLLNPGAKPIVVPPQGAGPNGVAGMNNAANVAFGKKDYQGVFNAIFPGESLSPEDLAAHADELGRYGIKVNRNASGKATDITLPDGTVVDPIQGAGSGLNKKQWLVGGGGGNPNMNPQAVEKALNESQLTKPWTQQFQYADWKPPAAWQAPDNVTEQNDPGYKFRIQQAQDALEHAASAKGTLLSGQTQRDLNDYIQNTASAEYGNVYNRSLTNYTTQYGAAQNDWLTNYNKALQGYQQSYNIFENNQGKQFNRLASLMGAGQTAAGQLNSAGLGYSNAFANTNAYTGSTLGGIYQGQGNAAAAGVVGSGNAYGNYLGQLGNYAGMAPYYRSGYGQQQPQPGYYGPPTPSNYGLPGFTGVPT